MVRKCITRDNSIFRIKKQTIKTVMPFLVVGLLATILFTNSVQSQDSKENSEFKNLKVLPQDITEDELIPIMKNFTRALGVRCNTCHVRDTSGDEPKMDYVSEENKLKDVTRVMMNLVNEINYSNSIKMGIPENKLLQVSCMTCHRGQLEPHLIEEILREAYADDGVDTMLSRYSYLRDEYYGSHTYDFTAKVLMNIGGEIYEEDSKAGLKVLMFNLDLFPKSSRNYAQVAFIHAEQGDTATAITFMKSAVEHSPNVPWYNMQLQKLTGE